MRIAAAALAGVVLALLTSFGVVRVVTTSQNDTVTKPLYNYGSR
ncbi:hypothetical protein [Actinomadura sp. DC4]|nr:hypothetical protein [Actinomadura sp. DC4]MDN3355670.1 hypothetical protein [Actinomadura sp. DC4]